MAKIKQLHSHVAASSGTWEPHVFDGLTPHQAVLLSEMWPHLEDGWAASPYFGTVREHTRAYIDRLASRAAREAQ